MQMKRLFQPIQIIFAMAGVLLGMTIDILTGLLAEAGRPVLITLFLVTGIFVLITLVVQVRQRRQVRVTVRTPITLRRQEEKEAYARRGLVIFVSLYNPIKSEAAKSLTSAERLQAAREQAYQHLDLENSNLQPAIEAITSHASRLEHCWLVSTSAKGDIQAGSHAYVPVLIQYLQQEKGIHCMFYGTDGRYSVPLDDDALVAIKTRDKIEAIFAEAEDLGLAEKEIVADFTGCPRSMTLGLILACLDSSRDIQFAGTHYNDKAEPVGDLFPILFDFEPELTEG